MHRCPPQFSGTLIDFVNQHVTPNLLSEKGVAEFHKALMQYIDSNDAIYILRQVGEAVRFRRGIDEKIYSTNEGFRFKASDNSPAWWIHYLLFHGDFISLDKFQKLIDDIPMHMYSKPGPSINVKRGKTINSFGYHVAHIYDVKDSKTDYENYSKKEIIKRFIRNIHPLNCFYISTVRWQYYGKKIEIRSYFADLYSKKYGRVWNEFIEMVLPTEVETKTLIYNDSYPKFQYCYKKIDKKNKASAKKPVSTYNVQDIQLGDNVPLMMIDVDWTDYGGWKPWQYKSDMDQLAIIRGSKIRFNLLKKGAQKFCIEMNLYQWKMAMERHMKTPYWITHGSFWIPLTKRREGKFTEEFKPNWKPYVKKCPCENVVPTICKPEN